MDSSGPPYDKWNSKLGANPCNQTDQKAKTIVDNLLSGNQNTRHTTDNQSNKNISPPQHTDCSNFH